MADDVPRSKLLFARLAIVLMIVFVALGLAKYGLSAEVISRIWQNLLERPGGAMTFRFFLQPVMAGIAAYLDGVRDARAGRDPFLYALLTDPASRVGRLNEALIATSRIILLGLLMDSIFQYIEFDVFKPGEAAIVAILLAFVPYVLLRGLVTRIARSRAGHRASGPGRSPG